MHFSENHIENTTFPQFTGFWALREVKLAFGVNFSAVCSTYALFPNRVYMLGLISNKISTEQYI